MRAYNDPNGELKGRTLLHHPMKRITSYYTSKCAQYKHFVKGVRMEVSHKTKGSLHAQYVILLHTVCLMSVCVCHCT